jgi:hypothetical protein
VQLALVLPHQLVWHQQFVVLPHRQVRRPVEVLVQLVLVLRHPLVQLVLVQLPRLVPVEVLVRRPVAVLVLVLPHQLDQLVLVELAIREVQEVQVPVVPQVQVVLAVQVAQSN